MLIIESRVEVPGLTGRDVTDVLLNPTDATYQAW